MEGNASLVHGPLRPIPVHCQRPPLGRMDLLVNPLSFTFGLDLRSSWKPLLLGDSNKTSDVISSLPVMPSAFTLYEHLRRHHAYVRTADITRPKITPSALPGIGQSCSVTLSLPRLPLTAPVPDSLTRSTIRILHDAADAMQNDSVLSPLAASMATQTTPTSPYGRKVFPCPQCRYTTDRRNNLKRHMLTMHQVSGKLLECCGVPFQTKASLREHALVFHYHGYTCFYCGRSFCRKALLKRHLSVHNGMKEFICNVCDYATSHKSNLERHRRVHARQESDTDLSRAEDVDAVTSEDRKSDASESMCSYEVRGHGLLCSGYSNFGTRSEDQRSNLSESTYRCDVSIDEISVCSDDDDEEDEDNDEEINVHSD